MLSPQKGLTYERRQRVPCRRRQAFAYCPISYLIHGTSIAHTLLRFRSVRLPLSAPSFLCDFWCVCPNHHRVEQRARNEAPSVE